MTKRHSAVCARKWPRMDKDAEHRLVENIIVKTQGFVNGNITEDDLEPVNKFREFLELYKGIDADRLRANMAYFLNAIMPVCDEYGIDMCVHPDDPPMPILRLPGDCYLRCRYQSIS